MLLGESSILFLRDSTGRPEENLSQQRNMLLLKDIYLLLNKNITDTGSGQKPLHVPACILPFSCSICQDISPPPRGSTCLPLFLKMVSLGSRQPAGYSCPISLIKKNFINDSPAGKP
jgi:hypothetical protein